MAQSLCNVLVHIIFSTKNRFAFLAQEECRGRMHAFLAAVFAENDCPVLEVGGTADHVHVFCSLSRNHAISEVIRRAKANSSGWVKRLGGMLTKFSWQSGYGAFSVHPSQKELISGYIRGQLEHHRCRSFQEEFLDFLREYQIPYDPRYIWR